MQLTSVQGNYFKHNLLKSKVTNSISFKGESNLTASGLEYMNTDRTREIQKFRYDRVNGNFVYAELDENNEPIFYGKFYPETKQEILFKRLETGTQIVRRTPEKTTKEVKDSKNRQTYFEEILPNGIKKKTYTEHEIGRRIHLEFENGQRKSIIVTDLRDGKVPEVGSKLLEKTQITETGDRIVFNIMTGEVYEFTKTTRDEKGKIVAINETILSRHTLKPTRQTRTTFEPEKQINTLISNEEGKKQERTIEIYPKSFIKTPETVTRIEHHIIYDSNEREKSHSLRKEDKKGNTLEEAHFFPNTKEIKAKIVYHHQGEYRSEYINKFDKETQKAKLHLVKEFENDVIQRVVKYQPCGKLKKHIAEFSDGKPFKLITYFDGTNTVEKYEEYYEDDTLCLQKEYWPNGRLKIKKDFDVDGYSHIKEYDSNGKINKISHFNPSNENYAVEFYKLDNNNKPQLHCALKKVNYEGMECEERTYFILGTDGLKQKTIKKGNITLENTNYYPDGITPYIVVKFNSDGSYTKTVYDEDGLNAKVYEYGTPKVATNPKTAQCKSRKEISIKDIVKEIYLKTGLNGFNIRNIDKTTMDEFLKYIGISNIEELEKMETKTYRRLSKAFHPDKTDQNDKEKYELNSRIFAIINNIKAQRK